MKKKAFMYMLFVVSVYFLIAVTWCSDDVTSINTDTGEGQRVCTNSAQCAKDESCINNICVKKDGGTIAACRNATDCAPDEECINSVCQKKRQDAGWELPLDTDAVEVTPCNYNSDCNEGFVCNTETHTCVAGGRIKVEPTQVEFGSASPGQEIKKSVVATNIGNGPLTIYLVDFESSTNPDPNLPRFTRMTDKIIPTTLQPNDSLNIDIIYKQDDASPDNGFLVINSSDITQPSVKVFLYSKYKMPPDLIIVDRSFNPPKVLYPQSGSQNTFGIDLGNVPIGGSKDVMVTLYNQSEDGILAIKGANIIQMSKNKIDVEFKSVIDPNMKYTAPFYLGAGEMVDIYVKYTPSQKEAQELTRLSLVTNDPDINNDYIEDTGELTINIVGQAGYVPPGINVDKTQINFGEVQVSLSAEDIFNICNTGEDALSIEGTSGLENPNTDYSLSPTRLGGTLTKGACIEVKVKFSPKAEGDQFNKVIIKSNDPLNPVIEVRLFGKGTDPNMVVQPSSDIDFGIVEVGKESAVVSITIFNSGKGSLSIDFIGLSVGSSSDFVFVNLPQQFPVALKGDGQEDLSFGIKFRPSVSSDPHSIKGAIEIRSNDKDNQQKYLNLSGIGFQCPKGFSDCNNDMGDRCETNILTSTDHCGVCGKQCVVLNGTPVCINGSCAISRCNQYFEDCDKLYSTGCETPTGSDINNCGTCNLKCSVLNGLPKCNAGNCEIDRCNTPYRDCRNGYADGCETNTNTDPNNCGTCGKVCSANNATSRCLNGFCALDRCDTGFRDCDGVYSNGCEIFVGGDVNNCGDCGAICMISNANPKCVSGQCEIDTCIGDYRDCDGKVNNGCEINISNNVSNCGFCGFVCNLPNASPRCANKTCAVDYCLGSYKDCNLLPNDGCEVNSNTDVNNCGTCGNICTVANGTATCSSGMCAIASCNAGYRDCKNGYSDGCETNITNDVNNCGNCGNICSIPPYTTSIACQSSTCVITGCTPTYYNVNGAYPDGCECRQDDNDISNLGNTSATAIDLGTLRDSSKQYVEVSGKNIVPSLDADWYKVVAEDVSTAGYNNFHFIVEIVGCNPATPSTCEFQIEVYKNVVDNNNKVCSNDVKYEFTVNFRQDVDGNGKNEGENPCTASCTSNDFVTNCCHNYTATYYIKVYRRDGAAASCNSYTLRITNGT